MKPYVMIKLDEEFRKTYNTQFLSKVLYIQSEKEDGAPQKWSLLIIFFKVVIRHLRDKHILIAIESLSLHMEACVLNNPTNNSGIKF